MKNIFSAINTTFQAPDSGQAPGLSWWRERLLNGLLGTTVLLSLLAIVPVLFRAAREGAWGIVYIDWAAIGLATALLLARRIPYVLKAIMTLSLAWGLGLAIILMTDLTSIGGLLWLFASAVLAGILLGLRGALAALAANGITLAVLGFMIHGSAIAGAHPWLNSLERLAANWSNFMLANTIVVLSAALLVRGLESTINREKEAGAKLEEERERLQAEIRVREKIEDALSESESKYRLLAENATDVIWTMDPQAMRLTYITPAVEAIWGFTPEESMQMSMEDFMQPKSFAIAMGVLQEEMSGYLSSGKMPRPRTLLLEIRDRQGTDKWVEIATKLVINDDGGVRELLGVTREVTERVKAHRATTASEEKYRQLVDHAPAGIYEEDLVNHRFLSVNDVMCEYTGYSREELLTIDPLDILSGESKEQRLKRHQQLLAGEDISESAEFQIRTKDGQELWVLVSGNQIFEDGVPVRARMVAYDITERKLAELARQDSEEKYRNLFENTSDFIYTQNLDGIFISVNPAICTALGYASDEIVGRPVTDFMLAEHREAFYNTYLAQLIKKGLHNGITVYLSREGKKIYTEYRSFLVSKDGAPLHISGTGRDVTSQRQANLALLESEERYRMVFNESPDAITISELATASYIDVNDGFCTMTGYTREDVVGKTLGELNLFYDPQDRERYLEIMGEHGKVDQFEIRFRIKDGSVKNTLFSARKIRFAGIDCLAVVVRDVTPLKKAERERSRLEEQLQHAQKMEAVGTLAGGIAHDFNNILAMVMGYGELAMDKARQGTDNSDDVGQIVKAAERARKLVQQILTFSRRSEIDLKPLDLNECVIRSVRMLEHTIPKMIEIQMKLAGNLDSIQADAAQIEQVVMNLASNAADAMGEGGRLIFETSAVDVDADYARRHLGTAPGRYVLLAVTDTGQGMDKDTLDQIFNPFFTTKEIGKGTGLGLSTAYGIVQEHGGRISCYSEPGQGTTFKIFLPAYETELDAAGEQAPTEVSAPGGHETLLLVDDEPALRELGSQFLQAAGYRVLRAASGEEALASFRQHPSGVDLIILDLGMPGMGGHKCMKELLAIDPKAKILIASGYSANGKVQDTLAQGASGFIAKPFRIYDLLHKVRSVLDA